MFYHLVLISLLITSWNSINSSEAIIYFDVVHNTKVIGNLKATRTIKDSKTYYHSSTTIKTRIIKKIRVNYKYVVIFDAGLLEKSAVHITVNEKPHAETFTRWEETNYQIMKNDKEEKTIKDSISYATVQLYFKEPLDISTCYSEQDGSFNTIIAIGNHSYKKINSKGKENIYYYETGILKKIIVDGGIIKFEIIAKSK